MCLIHRTTEKDPRQGSKPSQCLSGWSYGETLAKEAFRLPATRGSKKDSDRAITTRPFRYDLNQIPYDYTVEVRNRFKGLDQIDRVPDELWKHCTGDRDQDHPHGKEMQKSKMAVWGGLTNSCEKKRSKKQRRKGKI